VSEFDQSLHYKAFDDVAATNLLQPGLINAWAHISIWGAPETYASAMPLQLSRETLPHLLWRNGNKRVGS
jgi:hypothetical protein